MAMTFRKMVFAFACTATACGFGAEYGFDLRPMGMRLAAASASTARQSDGVLRSTSIGSGSTAAEALAVGDRLVFRLFDDVETVLVLKERTESPLGGETFLAAEEGTDSLSAVVMQDANGITANVTDSKAGRVYTVVSTASGVTVRELDQHAGSCEPCRTVVPDLRTVSKPKLSLTAASSDQPSTIIDVLAAFDRSAAIWADQNGGGITNFATMAVQKMNTAIGNTGFSSKFRFRLVGAMAVGVDGGSDFDGTLTAVQSGKGDWAPVKEMRDLVGADTVTVLVDTGSAHGTTGLGFSLTTTDFAAFSEHAFNVCSVRSVAQSHTMTHETGHNLGAGHSDQQATQRGPQLYSYSAGYYFTAGGNNYHTIMAYNSDGYGNSYTEIPYFSSPNYQYEGESVGDATHHDNVRTINNTYAAAAAWRKQVVPMSYDVYFSPESGSTFSSSLAVTLTPGKAGLSIRYTLDGSMPTTSSTLYTDPIVLTQTTTIRAVTVTDNVAGPVFEASYFVSNLGTGVDAPHLVWRTSSDYPWTYQTTNTYDGVDAVQSGWMPTDGYQHDTWLETDVTGPTTMSFAFKRGYMSQSVFSVACDGVSRFTFDENGYPNDWQLVEIDIPAGRHVVRFNFEQGGYYRDVFNGIYLDQVRFDALSRPPTITPTTTSDEATATTFTDTMVVVLEPPDRPGVLYYTLDGSDPTGEGGKIYEDPIVLTESTRVRAVFVEGGKDPSVEVGGLYLERHPVKPGEWTTDVAGARAAAAKDGRLIAVLYSEYGAGDSWSRKFYPVATSDAFLSWAAANGIYLVSADESVHCDATMAKDWFDVLFRSYEDSSYYELTFYFARPDAPDTAIGKGVAINFYGQFKIGTVVYDDTVEALVAGIASVLGETVPGAPTSSSSVLASSYPANVTLANTNGSGTIYYTLDGSAPTREKGTAYTGAIRISAPTTLKAAVWPDTGCSSPMLIRSFKTCGDVMGQNGIVWSMDGDYNWVEYPYSTGVLCTQFIGGQKYTSRLQATVYGSGKLVFTLFGTSYSEGNRIAFSQDGVQKYSFGYAGGGITNRVVTLTNEITKAASTPTTFAWTYTVDDSDFHFYVCGAWLYGLQWIPDGTMASGGETMYVPCGWGTPIAVNNDWLIEKGVAKAGDSSAAVAAKLSANGPNGIPRYQSYLLGMEPESDVPADEQLKVTLEGFDDDGLPIVSYEPEPNEPKRVTAVKMGKPSLSSADWVEVTDGNKADMRFYRIKVRVAP